MFDELEHKFTSILNKIVLKKNSINDSFEQEIKAVNEKFNKENLLEKYSNELNLYRDELLQQTSQNFGPCFCVLFVSIGS